MSLKGYCGNENCRRAIRDGICAACDPAKAEDEIARLRRDLQRAEAFSLSKDAWDKKWGLA